MAKKLILASASPRRREILDISGYTYEVVPSSADEITQCVSPSELVRINALLKAKEVSARVTADCVVLGADTVVCLENTVLGKPKDEQDAFDMLKRLSGSRHCVLTGYAVVNGEIETSGFCTTEVKFRELSDEEILSYVATKEPMDKAGSYGIQERACLFAESFSGDYFNIIGLPIAEIYPILKKFGVLPDWQKLI